ncbi:mpv17-like protein [Megalops cyprinoides]|uniref:mpv17-like protein n=1 Tax=Megalops cyprinoides TaxID=118141 RepID=UPI001864FFBF|nr:mpv17-like protein [Megalops cyprinoides]
MLGKQAEKLSRSHPYVTNVVGYTTLFATADLIQQSILGGKQENGGLDKEPTLDRGMGKWSDIDWSQTARVALVGFCFHANFNYNWLKGLETMWPGGGAKRVAGKVFLDQLIAAPVTISVFYIGLSVLEGRQDPFEDWREKFWTSYKTGVVYWSTMQALNFSLVPPVARTVFVGGITLGWTVFLCHLRQQKGLTHKH